jgi:hypothetical protein
MTKEEIVQQASTIFGNSNLKEIEQNSELIENVGYRFWQPTRGGRSFIIGFDGGYLESYVSSINPQELVNAYKEGRRTEPGTS